jgi:MFS family permease
MGAVLSPLIAWIIISHGWRTAAIAIGVVLWTVALPLSRMLRRPSADQPIQDRREGVASSSGGATQTSAREADFTVMQALRTRAFWIIPLAQAANGFTTTAVQIHGIPHLVEVGLSLQTAGFVMALFGIIEVCMRVFGSFIGDRVDKRYAILVYNTLQALGVVVLAVARSVPVALLFTVLFAVGHGGRGPLFVAIRGEFYGRNSFGTIMGIGNMITGISGVATPLILGVLFDIQGTYRPGLLSMAAITFVGGFLILFAVRPILPGSSVSQPTGV